MIDFKSPRKYMLPLNIIVFNLCRLWPFRNKKIWVLGAWEGKKFDDNSMYFIKYIKEYHSNIIRPIWLTNNPQTLLQVKEKGYEAYLNGSILGKWYQLRAGVSIYTNGLIDFGIVPLVGGSKVVSLWHGMSFKRIYNGTYTGLALITKKILDKFFSWTYRNITLVTSDYGTKWVSEMFTLNKKKIFITGQPRNDAFRNLIKADVLKKTTINPSKRLVVYMPTYRKPALGHDAMAKIIENLYNNKTLNSALDNTNSVFVAKLHPLTPHISLINRDNFMILDYAEIENNQELLGVADCLITDYSSCFIDYALLGRPIVFYTPDEASFFMYSEKVDDIYFDIREKCHANTPEEVAELIISDSSTVSKTTNDIYESININGTCYSENVYNVICKEIELN